MGDHTAVSYSLKEFCPSVSIKNEPGVDESTGICDRPTPTLGVSNICNKFVYKSPCNIKYEVQVIETGSDALLVDENVNENERQSLKHDEQRSSTEILDKSASADSVGLRPLSELLRIKKEPITSIVENETVFNTQDDTEKKENDQSLSAPTNKIVLTVDNCETGNVTLLSEWLTIKTETESNSSAAISERMCNDWRFQPVVRLLRCKQDATNNISLTQKDTTTQENDDCNNFSRETKFVKRKYKRNPQKHQSKTTCVICEKKFSNKRCLINHQRLHTGERPYNCDICHSKFARQSHLIVHQRRHTGERPYTCDICHSKFSDISTITKHKRTHTFDRPFTCEICCSNYSRRSTLLVHQRTHTGEKPYMCNVCQVKFTDSSTFIKHKRVHTGEKPYTCDICRSTFRCSSHLKVHQKVHKRKKTYY